MAEIVDYLFFFWFVFTGAVFLLGNLYEKQLRDKLNPKTEAQRANERGRTAQQGQQLEYQNQYNWSSPAQLSSYSSNYLTSSNQSNEQTNYNINQPHLAQQQVSSSSRFNKNDYPTSSYREDNVFDTNKPYYSSDPTKHSTLAAERSGPYDMTDPTLRYQPQDMNNNITRQQVHMRGDNEPLAAGNQFMLDREDLLYQQDRSSASIPVATGYNQDCVDWVNNVLYLFYSQGQKYGPIISESVYRSLNEKLTNITSSSKEYQHLVIEFQGLNHHMSTQPELTNTRTETETDKSVCVNCKIYNRRLMFDLLIRQATNNKNDYNQQHQQHQTNYYYELTLENLEGKLKSVGMLHDKLIVVQFMEKPETKIMLRQKVGPYSSSSIHQQQQSYEPQTLISEDLLVGLILQALTQVVVDLYFGDDLDFPQYYHQPNNTAKSGYRNTLSLLKGGASELKRQIKQDFFSALTSSSQSNLNSSSSNHQQQVESTAGAAAKERKVFIRIIRAKNINYNLNATCLLELDQPYQQAISSTKQSSQSSPYWDETFLFNINEKSQLITIELWDSINLSSADKNKKNLSTNSSTPMAQQQQKEYLPSKSELISQAKFLGSIPILVDDLRREPVQKVSLMLQSLNNSQASSGGGDKGVSGAGLVTTDLSNDSVGGELELELLFLQHSAAGQSSQNPTAAPASATTTRDLSPSRARTSSGSSSRHHQLQHSNSTNSLVYQQGDVVSVDRKLTQAGYVITTTTITKPTPQMAAAATVSGKNNINKPSTPDQLSVAGLRNHSPISMSETQSHELEQLLLLDNNNNQSPSSTPQPQDMNLQNQQATTAELDEGGHRSRSRSRSRTFLRAIKKRFSFSRTRSRSVGGGGDRSPALSSRAGDLGSTGGGGGALGEDAMGRSQLSIDSRSRTSSFADLAYSGGRAKSVPASRDPNEVPTIVINKSRLSDTASAFNFAQPKSQLVIECFEPKMQQDGSTKERGQVRHYLIPENSSNKNKWRKRGTKLHLFNEHQFVATHLAGSSTCHLCGRVFSRRPGKQGYKCRNCHLLSHKECHVKVDHNCPYAKKDSLKLEFIDADPPANLVSASAAESSSSNNPDNYNISSSTSATSGGGGNSGTLPRQQQHQSTTSRSSRLNAKSISMEVDDR